jgi:membrane-bound inhibitor of C-type lysozyme
MGLARSGSGSRYVSKAADLEWWIKGREARCSGSPTTAVLLNCREG